MVLFCAVYLTYYVMANCFVLAGLSDTQIALHIDAVVETKLILNFFKCFWAGLKGNIDILACCKLACIVGELFTAKIFDRF